MRVGGELRARNVYLCVTMRAISCRVCSSARCVIVGRTSLCCCCVTAVTEGLTPTVARCVSGFSPYGRRANTWLIVADQYLSKFAIKSFFTNHTIGHLCLCGSG